MIGPVPRVTTGVALQNKSNKAPPDPKMASLQENLQDAVEELAMARSLFKQKDKATISRERSSFLENKPELIDAVNEVFTGEEPASQEKIMNMLAKVKDDVSRYQLLRFLLESGQLDAVLYQFVNSEIAKLRKKRKKITSLDQISAETLEFENAESLDGIMLQQLYLDFLEYDGPITSYFETLFKSSKKYKKIARFLSRVINYDIYGYIPFDDIDSYIYLNQKRRDLNLISGVYSHFDNDNYRGNWFVLSKDADKEKDKNQDNQQENRGNEENNKEELNKEEYDEDLLFISSVLMNTDVDEFCSRMKSETVSMLVTYFNLVHVDLFYSVEDKIEALDTMKSNVSHRFIRNGIK